ncbi:hypothetical protein ABT297_13950 [Dactylosporangium sp. NPDC000555]|uniref:hypothetical protein n=1 Tax=Dactylosporangium sp. NPDC000555 TaxID=3154260 RepID=UPI00331A649A
MRLPSMHCSSYRARRTVHGTARQLFLLLLAEADPVRLAEGLRARKGLIVDERDGRLLISAVEGWF